jgi:hypothetical protein
MLIRLWEGLEMAETIDIILVFTKAVMLGFLDKLRSLAVQGRDLKVTQN